LDVTGHRGWFVIAIVFVTSFLSLVASYHIDDKRGSCREGMISHFQGWKDAFYTFTTRPPSLETHSLLLTQSGIIPLLVDPLAHGEALPTVGEALHLHHYGTTDQSQTQGRVKDIRKVFTGDECEGKYCLRYSSKLKSCLSYLDCSDISLFRVGDPKQQSDQSLIVVGNEDSISSEAFDQTLRSWSGAKV
jgi:hypothetical protein